MKVYLVTESEQWEGSWPVKVYRNEEAAHNFAALLQLEEDDKGELSRLFYSVREIEADLDV